MSSVRKQYPFDLIEARWQRFWEENATFRAWNPGEAIPDGHPFARRHAALPKGVLPPKYYILDMFPYPSGAGLHVGHPEGYTATDILARYRRMDGHNVLHPMGWDAFGLPAEQYAIRTGQHPRVTTNANVANFRRQIKALGFSYDWSREVDTTNPGYFKWTQWIFLRLYNSWFNPATAKAEPIETLPLPAGLAAEAERQAHRDSRRLAYVAEMPVWWCEELGTVLANEEVVDGKSEVGGFPVVRKPMRQWMLRITAYAGRLIEDLDTIDWTDSLKEMQRNWIGRSEGAEVRFQLAEGGESVTVFTTRPDTLFGATYMVLSPEHKLVSAITTPGQRAEVEAYQLAVSRKSDLERTELSKEKTGVFTGAFALNPVSGERVPIWIADYVLATYGTGAIMAVPAHDERDLEFAQKFGLPVKVVVQAPEGVESIGFTGEGVSVDSGFLTGLPTTEAKRRVTDWLAEKELGRRTINYKLRDWLFSRQRYWGEPFPILWRDGAHAAVDENQLPVQPPDLTDFKPTASGEPPLARAADWVNLPNGAVRETNTMPQWAGSCWYYLRYIDAQNQAAFCGSEAESYWMGTSPLSGGPDKKEPKRGVDLYVGGTEHAVLHLLYARFWHKVLFDLGLVSTAEPFHKLVNQGLILGENGQKMSKSLGNVVNPDDILSEFGADSLRLYEMFMGPLEMVKPWSTKGVEGVYRFLGRVWRLLVDDASHTELEQQTAAAAPSAELLGLLKPAARVQDVAPTPAQLKVLHATIKKVTEDFDHLRFNTAISALMVFVNEAMGWENLPKSCALDFLRLLNPLAPHVAEELHHLLTGGQGETLAYQVWPKFDAALLIEDAVQLPVQVNGKLRDVITVNKNATPAEIEKLALACDKVQAFIAGKTVKKVIIVPGRVVNVAIG